MRWVGIAVVSKHIMHSVYASHRRRSLAQCDLLAIDDGVTVVMVAEWESRIVVNGVCVRHSPRVGNRFGG